MPYSSYIIRVIWEKKVFRGCCEANYADTGPVGGFRTCAFKTVVSPAKDDMLFCADIMQNGTLWNGGTGNFELIVPTAYGPGSAEIYYMYAELQ